MGMWTIWIHLCEKNVMMEYMFEQLAGLQTHHPVKVPETFVPCMIGC